VTSDRPEDRALAPACLRRRGCTLNPGSSWNRGRLARRLVRMQATGGRAARGPRGE